MEPKLSDVTIGLLLDPGDTPFDHIVNRVYEDTLPFKTWVLGRVPSARECEILRRDTEMWVSGQLRMSRMTHDQSRA